MSLSGETVRPERRALPAAVISIVAFLGASTNGAEAPEEPTWPSNVRVIEALRAPEAIKPRVLVRVPQLRVYDAEGRQLLNETGYRPELKQTLYEIFEGKRTPDESFPLSKDLLLLVRPDGTRLTKGSEASFTLVKYWAAWCKPCHKQSRDLAVLLSDFKTLKFDLIHVDAERRR